MSIKPPSFLDASEPGSGNEREGPPSADKMGGENASPLGTPPKEDRPAAPENPRRTFQVRPQRPASPPAQAPAPDTRQMLLARFIRFCSAIFAASHTSEAAALTVNRISELVRVDRAVLVRLTGRNPIVAVTGGGTAAQDSSFADAVETVRRRYSDGRETAIVPRIPADQRDSAPHLRKVQEAMGGTRILWLPLRLSHDTSVPPRYAVWLERWHGHPWEKADIELLQHAALFLGHGMARSPKTVKKGNRFARLAVLAAVVAFLALPVTSTVTAPARVTPDRPHYIFAPMDGILKELQVRPGQWVEKDDVLFRYDARVLDKRLDEAYRNVAVAKAKFIRLQAAAHRDPDARAELPVQELEVARAEADAAFFGRQRERADVRAGYPGVVVLDDPDALIGASLQTGQAVMSIADPSQNRLRIMTPSGDVGFLKEGARVSVRLDSSPLKSCPAVITRVGFEVMISEEQIPSVLTEAIWVGDPPDVRPGQKGVARIFGDSTFMGWQIFRKPFIAIRTLTGL